MEISFRIVNVSVIIIIIYQLSIIHFVRLDSHKQLHAHLLQYHDVGDAYYFVSDGKYMYVLYLSLDEFKKLNNEAIKEKYRFFSFGDCMFISNE